jgi:ABC-2 type transport system permease protein
MKERIRYFRWLIKGLRGTAAGSVVLKKNKSGGYTRKYTGTSNPLFAQTLAGIIVALVWGVSTWLFCFTSQGYLSAEAADDYFLLAVLSGIVVIIGFCSSFVVSVFFMNKSDEVLLSLPIKSFDLFLARCLMCLEYALPYGAAIIIQWLVFIAFYHLTFLSVLAVILCGLTLPFLAIGLSFLFTNLIGAVFNIRKHKSVGFFLTIIFALIGGFGYMIVGSAPSIDMADPTSISAQIIAYFGQIPPWITWIAYIPAKAVLQEGSQDWIYIIYQLLLAGFVTILLYFSAQMFYLRNLGNEGMAKKKTPAPAKQEALIAKAFHAYNRSPFLSFVRRDLALLRSNPMILIYSLVLPIILGLTMIFSFGSLDLYDAKAFGGVTPEGAGFGFILMSVLISASVPFVSYASVSEEGKGFYVLKTIPFEKKAYLDSQLVITGALDAFFTIAIAVPLVFMLKISPWVILYVCLAAWPLLLLANEIGLLFGIKYARFDWDNPNEITQNGLGPFCMSLVHFLLAIIGGVSAFSLTAFAFGSQAPVWIRIVNLGLFALFCLGFFFFFRSRSFKAFDKLLQKDI